MSNCSYSYSFSFNFLKYILVILLIWIPLWLNAQNTYYTYQSGSWDAPGTWTTDPSGSLHENPAVPGAADNVVILNGRTVNIASNTRVVSSVQIKEGGSIDLNATTGHDFGEVSGQGLLRLQSNTLPAGDLSAFTSSEGGAVEYYNVAADFSFARLTYNNLILNFDDPDRVVRAQGNMTINGNLDIQSGKFQINNNTGGAARTITISGSVYVHENGRIQLGADAYNHTFIVQGDFTIDGAVRFTDRNAPDYLNPGGARANVVFNSATADQHLFINTSAIFYRIGINKGIDDTYILHVEATDEDYFKLYGLNDF
jgi:archaellum component FlaG (FlaF/FlaG flagellin family)